MTEQAKQQIADAKTAEEKINQINEEWKPHLGHQLEELQGKIKRRTMQKLEIYEMRTREIYGLSALNTLFLFHHYGKSMKELAINVQFALGTLIGIFDKLGIPRLSQ